MTLQPYLDALKAEMQRTVVPTETSPAGPFMFDMLRYHLGWLDADFRPVETYTGKHLRPLLTMLFCELLGGDWRDALPAASAVELLHNYTLIHDDIEDRDRTRRGRETLWSLWGLAQAINAGDALYAIAYLALLRLSERGVPPERMSLAVQSFAAGSLRVTEGQALDIAFEQDAEVDEATYLAMIAGKTAALLSLSCELGGIVAGASPEVLAALREFGFALGIAFQMQDDLLGLWGDPQHTGKPAGADLRRRKKTLPILHGLAHSAELRALLAQPVAEDATVQRALQLLEQVGSRAYTEQRAADYYARAHAALQWLDGQGAAKAHIESLVAQLLHREK